jgi:predicted 2-oxoglutarate/Fe(II)-dependent dioxygenase YbiX
MRSGLDFEIYPGAVDAAALAALRAGVAGAATHEATVRTGGEDQVVRRLRRTRRVAVGDDLTELARRRLTELRPRLEARFAVGLGACETPQFLRYRQGDRFAAHQDSSVDPEDRAAAPRRVSAVLMLGSEGGAGDRRRRSGALTFFDTSATTTWQTCRVPVEAPAGSVIAFPSDLVHEVSPVRSGIRLSVVTWFHAAP